MHFLSIFFALAGIVSTALASAVPASDQRRDDVPRDLRLDSLRYSGDGCPHGSVTTLHSNDDTAISLKYKKFKAQIGPHIPDSDAKKSCSVDLRFRFSGRWQYAITSTEYSGHLELSPRVNAELKGTKSFTGAHQHSKFTQSWTGPFHEDFSLTDAPPPSTLLWSECGKRTSINIGTQLTLRSRKNHASGKFDARHGFIQTYHFQWKKCHDGHH